MTKCEVQEINNTSKKAREGLTEGIGTLSWGWSLKSILGMKRIWTEISRKLNRVVVVDEQMLGAGSEPRGGGELRGVKVGVEKHRKVRVSREGWSRPWRRS